MTDVLNPDISSPVSPSTADAPNPPRAVEPSQTALPIPALAVTPQTTSTPPQAALAITQVYDRLHSECSTILHNSLNGEFAIMVAESHVFLHELERWAEVIAPNAESRLLEIAAREYQYALLATSQGLYRQAFKGLRLVLEITVQAVYLSTRLVELQEWLESRKDTIWAELMDIDNGVLSVRFVSAFYPELKEDVRHHRSLALQLYRECSECVHGNVQKYIPLPNTLVFSPDSFRLWHSKAKNIALLVTFVLTLRYMTKMDGADRCTIEHDVLDRLGHIAAIRRSFGGPEGG